MNIGKLNMNTYQALGYKPDIMFAIRGAGARLFRVCSVPMQYDRPQVHDILREQSVLVKDGVYYMKIDTEEQMMDLVDRMALIDVDLVIAEDEKFARNRWGWPVPELCN